MKVWPLPSLKVFHSLSPLSFLSLACSSDSLFEAFLIKFQSNSFFGHVLYFMYFIIRKTGCCKDSEWKHDESRTRHPSNWSKRRQKVEWRITTEREKLQKVEKLNSGWGRGSGLVNFTSQCSRDWSRSTNFNANRCQETLYRWQWCYWWKEKEEREETTTRSSVCKEAREIKCENCINGREEKIQEITKSGEWTWGMKWFLLFFFLFLFLFSLSLFQLHHFSFFTKLEKMIAIQFFESHLFCIHKKAPEKFRGNFNSTHVPLIHNFLHHFWVLFFQFSVPGIFLIALSLSLSLSVSLTFSLFLFTTFWSNNLLPYREKMMRMKGLNSSTWLQTGMNVPENWFQDKLTVIRQTLLKPKWIGDRVDVEPRRNPRRGWNGHPTHRGRTLITMCMQPRRTFHKDWLTLHYLRPMQHNWSTYFPLDHHRHQQVIHGNYFNPSSLPPRIHTPIHSFHPSPTHQTVHQLMD